MNVKSSSLSNLYYLIYISTPTPPQLSSPTIILLSSPPSTMPLYHQPYPLSSQPKKIFCAYHQTEFLTNFCQQSIYLPHIHIETCLMPLCPSCIAQHTQQHFLQFKKPTYVNINQALYRAKQSCYCTIITLEQYKKLNQDIFLYISSLEQNIHLQLNNQKNHLFSIITQIFNDYQQRLIKQIHQNYMQKNVYLLQESLNASKFIDQEITNLYEKITLLKGQECLSSLITYYAVDQQNYKQALEEFDQYFEKNRKAGKLQISIIDQALKKLTTNLCDNLLSVQCVIQNFQPKPQEVQDSSGLKSKRYGFNKLPSNNNEVLVSSRNRQNRYQKENQQMGSNKLNQSLSRSRRAKQQIGIITHQQQQEREVSLKNKQLVLGNGHTNNVTNSSKHPLISMNNTMKQNQSLMSKQSMNINNRGMSSMGDDSNKEVMIDQDSKRLTRKFKNV